MSLRPIDRLLVRALAIIVLSAIGAIAALTFTAPCVPGRDLRR